MSEPTAKLDAPPSPRRTYVQQVIGDTWANRGAKFGLAWLVIVGTCAVFGPFIANSYPYTAVMADGTRVYPLFEHLSAVDVALPLITMLLVGLLLWRRAGAAKRWAMAGVGIAAIGTLCAIFVSPPLRVVYSEYREFQAAGEVNGVIRAPIPYSASDRQRDRSDVRYLPPLTQGHLIGTEANGADVLSRMIHASRIALAIGFIATGLAVSIGIVIGGMMGYFAGIVDLIGMRLVEIFSAIPQLFLMLTIVAVIPPQWNPYRLYLLMVIIGLVGWVGDARLVRAEFLKLRKQDFVHAAIAAGLPLRSVLFRHMLPNGVAPVLVSASFGVASAITSESVLSFLGLGLVDDPSWGQMLNESLGGAGGFKWWMAIFPGSAIFLTVFAFVLIGEALRDAIDPHLKRVAQA